ncbi:MAG TPA: hypothetical protein VLS89_09610, partial [Candidatus Nanopelagicales bacterium]|nr:hypothetical protein [Candidatus Nanopelagicales bacterium]
EPPPSLLYRAPHGATYRAPDGATWLHALHGSVPDHQIDFICSPEAPQGAFTRTHLGHLARLMKYIEPRAGSPYAFAIGNLSRDDTQHEPAHGAVALLFGLRIAGATDSAGRRDPPFAHAIIAVDRALTYRAFLDAATALHRPLTAHEGRRTPSAFYHEYARAAEAHPDQVSAVLQGYLDEFHDLPELPPSTLSPLPADGADTRPARIFLVHSDDEPFGNIARAASKLAALLYRSPLRWTAIVSGGAAHIPGGLSIELVTSLPTTLGPADRALRLDELPEDEESIALEILGTPTRARHAPPWRAPEPAVAVRQEIEVEVEVDLGLLSEPAEISATPRTNLPTPRPGRRWLRVGVVGAGLTLAGVTLLSTRGGSEPPAAVAGAVSQGHVEATPPGPAPIGTPLVVDSDGEMERPGEELAKVEASVPRGAAPKAEPVRARTAAPREKAPRIFGGREPVWMKEAEGGRR